jgi:excisionase family DNA binding protein
MADTNEQLLSVSDVAQALNCDRQSVIRWIQSGQLAAIRLGDGQLARYRVTRSALAQFLVPAGKDSP